jgi:hypothetical protein
VLPVYADAAAFVDRKTDACVEESKRIAVSSEGARGLGVQLCMQMPVSIAVVKRFAAAVNDGSVFALI